jgi:hypothetical protein
MTLSLSCAETVKTVDVPGEPDRCHVLDPGDAPTLDMEYVVKNVPDDGPYVMVRKESLGNLFVWERDVGRLREALLTCPSVIMIPYGEPHE